MSDFAEEDQARHDQLVIALKEAGFDDQETNMLASIASRLYRMTRVNKMIITDDMLEHAGRNAKRQFDAFVKAGFTEDQAIQIIARNPMSLNLTSG